jgi:hypothetical protein
MMIAKIFENVRSGWLRLALLALWLQPYGAGAALEETFDVLQIGTTLYRNVTITTKNKDYIFIMHSKGMTNVKVRDLPLEVSTKLGYADPAGAKAKSNTPAAWARQTISKIEAPQVKQLQDQLMSTWRPNQLGTKLPLPPISQNVLLIGVAALFAFYFFHCYCCMLICKKAGSDPGVLVWLPVLQLVPMLKAAAMSPWWLLGFFVPGFNLLAQALWCIKITQARGKPIGVAILFIFPLTSPFAFLYLAFSDAGSSKKDEGRVEIMTLETA